MSPGSKCCLALICSALSWAKLSGNVWYALIMLALNVAIKIDKKRTLDHSAAHMMRHSDCRIRIGSALIELHPLMLGAKKGIVDQSYFESSCLRLPHSQIG